MTYRLLTIFLWPVFFIYTLKISLRDKSLRYFLQRLGFFYPTQKQKHIWIHCASVGEVNTYLPLHLQLLKQHPDTQFIISTNTVTGANTVLQHNCERTSHCFLPVESGFAIKHFLKTWQPSQCIIMETELWPLLYQVCYQQGVSISIINARLSVRTLSANNWLKSLYKTSLSQVNKILCKSADELKNFKSLGAQASQLEIAGNLKFSFIENRQPIKPIDLNNRIYCVAASTHNNEEQQLASLWEKLQPNMLLVIVPRHPNRSQQIQTQLDSLNLNYAVRSQQQAITANTQVYLADTLGELTQFMQGAQLVFMGGSLIEHGGQNILEAGRLGKNIVCGPHMFNFKEEMQLLLEHNACLQAKDITELEATLSAYFNDPQAFNYLGENAQGILKNQSDILNTYLVLLNNT